MKKLITFIVLLKCIICFSQVDQTKPIPIKKPRAYTLRDKWFYGAEIGSNTINTPQGLKTFLQGGILIEYFFNTTNNSYNVKVNGTAVPLTLILLFNKQKNICNRKSRFFYKLRNFKPVYFFCRR